MFVLFLQFFADARSTLPLTGFQFHEPLNLPEWAEIAEDNSFSLRVCVCVCFWLDGERRARCGQDRFWQNVSLSVAVRGASASSGVEGPQWYGPLCCTCVCTHVLFFLKKKCIVLCHCSFYFICSSTN